MTSTSPEPTVLELFQKAVEERISEEGGWGGTDEELERWKSLSLLRSYYLSKEVEIPTEKQINNPFS